MSQVLTAVSQIRRPLSDGHQILTETWSPFFKISVDWRVILLLWLLAVFDSCSQFDPMRPPFKWRPISKSTPWWSWKIRISREWEKINSRSRCREYPRCLIHGVFLVYHRQIERNWNVNRVEIWIALDVRMDGRRFDVGVSDPFLKIFLIINGKWR